MFVGGAQAFGRLDLSASPLSDDLPCGVKPPTRTCAGFHLQWLPDSPRECGPAFGSISRMIDAVVNGHLLHIERVEILQAPHVETVLARIKATLVVGVDAARRAEEVLRRVRFELIDAKGVRTFRDSKAADRYCRDHSPTSPAHRTVAMLRID